ncbi:MAG: CDP-diacylglycerol--serine O-phosphatidyltransferase [Myxococcales bacterium]
MSTTTQTDARDKPTPRHFSMIRNFQAADLITLVNGFSGTGAVLSLMKYLISHDAAFLWTAFVLFPIALVADFMDGRVARWRGKSSLMGQELDSLADVVSFGVAPAALAFALGMQGGLDVAILLYFVGCGISRLARYNVTATTLADKPGGKVKYYEGTPIPTSLLLVGVLAFLAWQGRIGDALPFGSLEIAGLTLHPLTLLWFLSGSAMISKTLHIPKP